MTWLDRLRDAFFDWQWHDITGGDMTLAPVSEVREHTLTRDCWCNPKIEYVPADTGSVLVLTPDERDMLVAICDEGIEDWSDQTVVGLRAKVLRLAVDHSMQSGRYIDWQTAIESAETDHTDVHVDPRDLRALLGLPATEASQETIA